MSTSIILSGRPIEYQKQCSIVQRVDGSLTFAPVNRFALTLPPELTSQIFLFCLPPPNWKGEFAKPDPSTAPLLLLSICRQWRNIALHTPGLWTSLYLDLNWFRLDLPYHGLHRLFCDWLSRTGDLPLSIRIDEGGCYNVDGELDMRQLFPVLEMIGRLSTRWETIWFSVFPEHLFSVEGRFPRLKKLGVECSSDFQFEWHYIDYPPRELRDASMLQEIQLFRAPWTTLTIPPSLPVYLSEKIGVYEGLDILRSGTGLSRCTLYLVPDPPRSIIPLPPIANLQDLTLSECADTPEPLLVMKMLKHLTLPSLKNLSLRFEDADDRLPADITEFISFISRSSLQLKLQTLTLCLVPTSETRLLQCIQSIPSLVALQLQLSTPISVVLDRFTCDARFLPRLQSLHVMNYSFLWGHNETEPHQAPDAEQVLEMLAARYSHEMPGNCVQLQSFRFGHGRSEAMKLFAARVVSDSRYQKLAGAGMDLFFGDGTAEYDSWYVNN
ncbi:hypothetical protein DFH07DRAFT_579806 [Mycena maculata]|uniref:F-box domain-containing protein n=1 Tax=Mycena maculata TaxID=230809 RepID=A0AAD7IQP0_9AGAR|nr:hypothetical protein DFH07DRAFT_579806 [Mycena maculata]